jgi:hypothetical protein
VRKAATDSRFHKNAAERVAEYPVRAARQARKNLGKLDDQQRQQGAQRDAHADHNEHKFGVMSNVGNGVPPIEKLAHLRNRYQKDGGNRDEGVEPAVHVPMVTPHPSRGSTMLEQPIIWVSSLWLKLDFVGYGLQPVHKPCIISGALAPEGGFSSHSHFHHRLLGESAQETLANVSSTPIDELANGAGHASPEAMS